MAVTLVQLEAAHDLRVEEAPGSTGDGGGISHGDRPSRCVRAGRRSLSSVCSASAHTRLSVWVECLLVSELLPASEKVAGGVSRNTAFDVSISHSVIALAML